MSIWKAFFVTACFIIIFEIFQIIPATSINVFGLTVKKHAVLVDIVSLLATIISFIVFYKLFIKTKPFIQRTKIAEIKFSSLFLTFIIASGIILFNKILINGYYFIFRHNYEIVRTTKPIYEFDSSAYVTVLSAIIMAAIIEETVFRKFIFVKLLKKNSLITSIFVSSICFSLIHYADIANLLPTFIAGVFTAIIFYHSQNIIYAMAVHFFNNFSWAFFTFYDHSIPNYFQEIKFSFFYWILTFGGLGIALVSLKIFIQKTAKAET